MIQKTLLHTAHTREQRRAGSPAGYPAVLLLLFAGVLLAQSMVTGSVRADAPEVDVEVVPTSVALPSEDEVTVLVIARNSSNEELRDVRLTCFADAGVTLKTEAPGADVLLAHGALVWTVKLAQSAEGAATGKVYLRIDYSWQTEAIEQAVPRVATGSFEVKAREPETAQQVAQVQTQTALTSLMEHRPGIIYLVVTNTSNAPIRVTGVSVSGPDSVTFTQPVMASEVALAPLESRGFPVEVHAKARVRPGRHLLLFEVGLKWEKAGRTHSGTVIATHGVDVGVLGESEILKALGIPSFLVLPGFLMTTMVSMLYLHVSPRRKFPVEAAKPEFWLIAITLSLLMALLYRTVTGWDYLQSYGLLDVMQVWFLSIILGAAGYFAIVGGIGLMRQLIAWWRVPSPDDGPIKLLRKLDRQGLGVILDRVRVNVEGSPFDLFILESNVRGKEALWVGPHIDVQWLEGATTALRQQVHDTLDKGDAAALADVLASAPRSALNVDWRLEGHLEGPTQVKTGDVDKGTSLARARIVQQSG